MALESSKKEEGRKEEPIVTGRAIIAFPLYYRSFAEAPEEIGFLLERNGRNGGRMARQRHPRLGLVGGAP